ncbi:hypothetical protein CDAR_533441 [Caerostris darwini]|uniref:Uncharacterized protein n=1 Tax=Caerostris darwini TaxID=1538125 RepID=A0AAV4S5B3_9ARAC|nr:hypothetical protein CDAR_533441 [Caerostris darwini]
MNGDVWLEGMGSSGMPGHTSDDQSNKAVEIPRYFYSPPSDPPPVHPFNVHGNVGREPEYVKVWVGGGGEEPRSELSLERGGG